MSTRISIRELDRIAAESDLDPVMLPVKLGDWGRKWGTKSRPLVRETVHVKALPTSCPYLVIHIATFGKGWTLSHTVTGYGILFHLPDVETARVCARVLDRVFAWSQKESIEYARQFKRQPKEIQDWIRSWRQE